MILAGSMNAGRLLSEAGPLGVPARLLLVAKILDFSEWDDYTVTYTGQEIPPHTQSALENYLIRGYQPGGFLTACLTGDLYRAVQSADTANRSNLWAIVRWIMNYAPEGSWGSAEAMRAWTADKGGRRSQYREQCEKRKTWLSLVK